MADTTNTDKMAVLRGGKHDGKEVKVDEGIQSITCEYVPGKREKVFADDPRLVPYVYYATGPIENGKQVFEIE